jgi:hypothetical protein
LASVVGLIPKLTSGEALASLMDGQGEPSITLDIEGAKLVKERTTLAFRTSWRGDAAVIRMEASRSRDGSGLGEWWVWADQVHSGDQRFGSEMLSDTARSRLSPLYEPAVNEWLAGPEYPLAFQRGLVLAIAREIRRSLKRLALSPGHYEGRGVVETNSEALGPELTGRFLAVLDALDAFDKSLTTITEGI